MTTRSQKRKASLLEMEENVRFFNEGHFQVNSGEIDIQDVQIPEPRRLAKTTNLLEGLNKMN